MDLPSCNLKALPDPGDLDKKRKHEVKNNFLEEESKPSHRQREERHSKHKHRHKHHRYRHGSHRKDKHDHREKSSEGTEDLDVVGEKDRDDHAYGLNNAAGQIGGVLEKENAIHKQIYKEEGEISEDQTFPDHKAAAESEIESGEIKSDGESAEAQPSSHTLTAGLISSRSQCENETVPGVNVRESGTLVTDAEVEMREDSFGNVHLSITKSNNRANAHAFIPLFSDGKSKGDTPDDHSHLSKYSPKETLDVEVFGISRTVEETSAYNCIQSDCDTTDASSKDAIEKENRGIPNYYHRCLEEESLMETYFTEESNQSHLGGFVSIQGCHLEYEMTLSPSNKVYNDGSAEKNRSISSLERVKSKNSKNLVASGCVYSKLHEAKSFHAEEISHDGKPLLLDGSSDARHSYPERHHSRSYEQTHRHNAYRKRSHSREPTHRHRDEKRRTSSRERTYRHKDERKRCLSREPTHRHTDEKNQSYSRESAHKQKDERNRSSSHDQRLSYRDERKRAHSREASIDGLFDKDSDPSKKRRSHSREIRLSPLQGALHTKVLLKNDVGMDRNSSPPSRSTHLGLQRDCEVSHEWRSRDLTSKSHNIIDTRDRMHARESLKSFKDDYDDRIKVSHSNTINLEKRHCRSRSWESLQEYSKQKRENTRHGPHHTASPQRRQRSRSRDYLKHGRSEDLGPSRYDRARERDRAIRQKGSQSSREHYRDEGYRGRYAENNRNGNEKGYSDHDMLKLNRQSSKKAAEFSLEDKAREEENQEVYVERVALQLAAQEEDDVEKIKEESRRRRQAILEKYKNQKLEQQELRETNTDDLREVRCTHEKTGEAQSSGPNALSNIGIGKQNGATSSSSRNIFDVSFAHGATLALGKQPSHKDTASKENVEGIIGLGEGSPKSERSPDIFCDDIFGESPAGGRKTGKGDGLTIDNSGLIDNWDDAEGYYCYRIGEVLDGRYEVASSHGRGVFSHVVRARDLKAGQGDPEEVAIKIIRNNETMFKAGQTELVILKKLAGADPEKRRHCVRLLTSFEYRSHLCLVFESLHMNLREVLKKFGRNIGINLHAVRAYAKQLFIALKHLRNCGVLHCDIKPDNMLVNEAKNMLKLCDFGSAMFAGENEITPYLVSRFYRAPEIILGIPYDHALDIWSVGCCLYELYTGKVLFPGPTNNDMLKLHMELKGPFPKKMLKKAAFRDQHYDQDYNFCSVEEDPVTKKMVKRVLANVKPLDIGSLVSRSGRVDEDSKMVVNFKDLLDKIFILDPDKPPVRCCALSMYLTVKGICGT